MIALKREVGPGPAKKRAINSAEGHREHQRAYEEVITASMYLARAKYGADRIWLLSNVENAVKNSIKFSNWVLRDLALNVLAESQAFVLDNGNTKSLIEAQELYWTASKKALS